MNELQSSNDFNSAVLESEQVTLVDFWAPWCGPCRALSPIIEQFSAANPEINILKVNIDEHADIATAYGVRSIPTLVVFQDGKEINRQVGSHGTVASLEKLVNENQKTSP